MHHISSVPWKHIPVWKVDDCRCFQNICLSDKQNCLHWKTYSCCSDHDIHYHENPHGKKPAKPQLFTGFIYPKPQLVVMTILLPFFWWWYVLSFFSAMRTHTGEKLAKRLVLAEVIHWPNMVVMTTIIPLFRWRHALHFFSAMWIHTGKKPAQLWLLSGFIPPLNPVACNLIPLDLWWHVPGSIIAMRLIVWLLRV